MYTSLKYLQKLLLPSNNKRSLSSNSGLYDLAYLLISFIVFIFVLSHIINQRFVATSDFWTHSAVVRELSLNPWSPEHPFYPIKATHEFYSPYSLTLGILSRISGLNSITVMSFMGIVNLCMFLYSLRLFSLKLSASKATAFFTLLFTMVLWGYNPWMFSQFYHLAAIGDTTLFPCCFTAVLTFYIWAKYIDFEHKDKNISFIFSGLLMTVVLLSHPPTGIIMYVGLFSLYLGERKIWFDKRCVIFVMVVLGSVALALFWPYYKLTDLFLLNNESQHHYGNRWMYVNILRNSFAALVGIPFLLTRFKQKRNDPVLIMFLLFSSIYILGYFSEKYVLGRVIPAIIYCLHFSLADFYGKILDKITSKRPTMFLEKISFYTITPLIIIFAVGFLAAGFYRYRPGRECTYSQYIFLKDYVKRQEVIITDQNTSVFIPSLAGKLVATRYPQSFVDDDDERNNDVNSFFSQTAKNSDRILILKKYKVDFILLNRQIFSMPQIEEDIRSFGKIIFSNKEFILVDVKNNS